jgi:hypothetical protein
LAGETKAIRGCGLDENVQRIAVATWTPEALAAGVPIVAV